MQQKVPQTAREHNQTPYIIFSLVHDNKYQKRMPDIMASVLFGIV